MNPQILIWIFIVIFSVTAIITLLGITGVIKTIKDKYLNALFAALILEVIAAVVGVFKGIDIEQQVQIPGKIFQSTQLDSSGDIHDDTRAIIDAVNKSCQVEVLQEKLAKTHSTLEECQGSLKELDKDFYSYIIKLRNAMKEYPERSININFRPQDKALEYGLLREIFIILNAFENPDNIDNEAIKNEWVDFKSRHGRADENKYHILEYDITLLVRDFLNKFYPLEKPEHLNEE